MQRLLLFASVYFGFAGLATAQLPPSIGYMFPPGGQAGKTVEVSLGGYDWTPDMQLFVHDPRIKLEILGSPGPVIVPEPPYWFGKKARRGPFLLPRETKARLTIPADVPPGVVHWQAANANGATSKGSFVVSQENEIVETDERTEPQLLESLPVVVSGQIKKIEEVDHYRFSVSQPGPITCSLCAREIGSDLNGVLEVYDSNGKRVASSADTAGTDTALTFAAKAGTEYLLRLYDLDFRGNRAFVYRLRVAGEPRVIAAFPPVGRPGETKPVEFVGYGLASGQAKLESVIVQVAFPDEKAGGSFLYRLKTSFGETAPVKLFISDLPEMSHTKGDSAVIPQLPIAINGILEEQFGEHRYRITAKKGDVLDMNVLAKQIGSPLDVSLAIYDAEGKERARHDDLPDSTDAALEFRVPEDGEYQLGVTDVSGNSGNRAAVYRLIVQTAKPDITFTAPEFLNLPIGGTGKIALKAIRRAGFKDPVAINLVGLPAGVSAPKDLNLPAGKTALQIDLPVAEDAAATASMARIIGEATLDGQTIRHETGPILIATTITPPFTIDAEGQDDVTKWPRGTIFPAPVLIERQEGFDEEIVLEMTSKQGRHRQGITGPELVVPPGVKRILYPVTLPEWLETTRTSRMVVNGGAKVADPQGNIRYSVSRQKTRMGFLPTGALLKLAAEKTVFTTTPGQAVSVPLSISRSPQLTEPARIELRTSEQQKALFKAEVQTVEAGQKQVNFPLIPQASKPPGEEQELTIRATILQNGQYPVVSETQVILQFPPRNH